MVNRSVRWIGAPSHSRGAQDPNLSVSMVRVIATARWTSTLSMCHRSCRVGPRCGYMVIRIVSFMCHGSLIRGLPRRWCVFWAFKLGSIYFAMCVVAGSSVVRDRATSLIILHRLWFGGRTWSASWSWSCIWIRSTSWSWSLHCRTIMGAGYRGLIMNMVECACETRSRQNIRVDVKNSWSIDHQILEFKIPNCSK